MKISFEFQDKRAQVDTSMGQSIAIRLDFEGSQPNHFGVEKAKVSTVVVGDFVGDTNRGGGCNVDTLTVIPHCNGTHTESVGHIVNASVPVGDLTNDSMTVARLVSLTPVAAADTEESYRPELDHHDTLITRKSLTAAIQDLTGIDALVIRTLPNDIDKISAAYGDSRHPAFLTVDAMQWIFQQGIRHLLLDLPSVDKMYDEGLLTNHHLFWNVPEGTHELTDATRKDCTISEMIFVPESVADGLFLLNLQVPAFVSDAAPSRPMLYPIALS